MHGRIAFWCASTDEVLAAEQDCRERPLEVVVPYTNPALTAQAFAAFSMTMLTSTAAGDAYTLSQLTAMYNEVGFGGVTAHPIPMSPHTVVVGQA